MNGETFICNVYIYLVDYKREYLIKLVSEGLNMITTFEYVKASTMSDCESTYR